MSEPSKESQLSGATCCRFIQPPNYSPRCRGTSCSNSVRILRRTDSGFLSSFGRRCHA